MGRCYEHHLGPDEGVTTDVDATMTLEPASRIHIGSVTNADVF